MDTKVKKGKMKMIMIGVLAVIAVALVILASVNYAPALKDENGKKIAKSEQSITELIEIDVNGSRQWISIRGQNKDSPVLLFLHGGPGSPVLTMTRQYFNGKIEQNFVVVNWEQRGASKSYAAGANETLTIDTMINDACEVIDYLRTRFGKDKVYIVGHSWGSLLGTLVASKFPEKIAGYCGIGQLVYGVDNERISYAWTMEQARARSDTKGIKALEAIAEYGENPRVDWQRRMTIERKWLGEYGGAMGHSPSFMRNMIMSMGFFSPEYSFMDIVNFLRGNKKSLNDLWLSILEIDLRIEVPRLDVPVLMTTGRYDYNTPCTLAEDYFNQLESPKKDFVWFENSAHSPCFEEPEKFADELIRFFLNLEHN